MSKELSQPKDISFDEFKKEVKKDYEIAVISRECSLLGRREVLTGKAKFGIFGDGKEVPQLALAKVFRNGDFRSGYYRDQTLFMAQGHLDEKTFFAALYANTDIEKEPMSGGRQMGGHFMTHSLDENGNWKNLMEQTNSSADMSPTAGQMPRLLGLGLASKIYRQHKTLKADKFSNEGNEIAWGTIGDASTSEGMFWETVNAAGVMQVPMVLSVWDDEYGISVHAEHQTTKQNISEVLEGFRRTEEKDGLEIIRVKAWDYPELIEAYQKAEDIAREQHVPVLVHVQEVTQPQGHSTSGSHERYKSKERLEWEKEYDCNAQMRKWMLENGLADEDELKEVEKKAKKAARKGKQDAWKEVNDVARSAKKELLQLLKDLQASSHSSDKIAELIKQLKEDDEPLKSLVASSARKALRYVTGEDSAERKALIDWFDDFRSKRDEEYSSFLYGRSDHSPMKMDATLPEYPNDAKKVDGRIVLRDNFDKILEKHPEVVIFGEDSGKIGDVNQGLEGLQEKHGEHRVFDTGIRETTIMGQGIGMAMRGLRPIAEIQYLDYLLYGLQTMSDDLSTLHYRSAGKQKAPMIVRTRGHRLEGIWHSGSPMAGVLNLVRGVHVLVPRNMTEAAGFYNTILAGDEPALIVESLNGYRLKEDMPENLGEFKTPLGKVEKLRSGDDITLVSYGSTLRIAHQAAEELSDFDIDVEVIDVRSLIPFDKEHEIVDSIKRTNRLLVVDEDVPGGCSAYIMKNILEDQDAYRYLDSKPETLTAKEHRPAFGTDGDYFSKPSKEDVFDKVYSIMNEYKPQKYPDLY